MELKTIKVQTSAGKVYDLRLTLGGQKALKKQYGEEILDILLTAITDNEVLAEVLQQSLHFAGSELDFSVTGEQVYEELIDSGCHGQMPKARLLMDLAECAGLISADQERKLLAKIERSLDDALSNLDDADDEPPPVSPEATR